MKCSIIAAVNNKNVIGKDGQLPWHIPEDLKWFKQHTTNKAIIMGRKTWESLNCTPLPNRVNLVVSSTLPRPVKPTHHVFRSLRDAVKLAKMVAYQNRVYAEIMFIGGTSIYEQALPLINTLYLTRVDNDCDGDAFFPAVDFSLFERSFHDQKDGYSFNIFSKEKR